MKESVKYDIIVVGAGIVGLTMASFLAQNKSLKVAVIENSTLQLPLWGGADYDLRVSAITKASTQLLTQLGVWSEILQCRASPFRQMRVWDKKGIGEIHFDSAEIGEAVLGYIVENNLIQHCLYNHLKQQTDVEFIFNAHLQTLTCSEVGASLQMENHAPLAAKLIIGADGAQSWVRQQMQSPVQQWDYGQHAIVATVQTEYSHQETAWQHFMPTGPLAFLPLCNSQASSSLCSIVWSTTPEHAATLQAINDEDFQQTLTQASEKRLGNILKVSSRACFPLRMRHVKNYVKPNCALIGDAAHTIHPLAGQGMNLGLQDAFALNQVIQEACMSDKDFACLAILRRYERWRKTENTTMVMAMEGFKRLFSNDNSLLSGLRNFGLATVDKQAWLKNFFMRYTI
jgi:2-octaprenylphenol hydroxylase